MFKLSSSTMNAVRDQHADVFPAKLCVIVAVLTRKSERRKNATRRHLATQRSPGLIQDTPGLREESGRPSWNVIL